MWNAGRNRGKELLVSFPIFRLILARKFQKDIFEAQVLLNAKGFSLGISLKSKSWYKKAFWTTTLALKQMMSPF